MEHEFTQEYFGQTVLHPVGLIAVVVLGIAMLVLPRRYAVIPMLVMACFIAPAQRIALFGLNLHLLRLLTAVGTVRVIARSEWRSFRWTPIDTIFCLWAAMSTLMYVLLWMDMSAVKLRAGHLYDQFGLYFLFRFLIRSWEDVWIIAKAFVVISVPIMLAFVFEHSTSRNLFAFLGGVPEITLEREGRLRCQGAFAHPILAGCFWAAQIPLIAALWWKGWRWYAVTGVFCSLVIIAMCASSTPLAGVACAGIGAMMFRIRQHLRKLMVAVAAMLFLLHMVMEAPVWHLIARIDLAGGSTGWHRANLISEAISHFGEWWLMGTRSLSNWNVFKGDVTNEFILQGVRGGLISVILFTGVLVICLRTTGRLCEQRKSERPTMVLCWALGVCLWVHVTNFVGVSYFGQIMVVFYLAVAMVASLGSTPQQAVRRVQPAGRRPPRRRLPALAQFR